ncbi:hypothetical protein HYW67_01505 [Candidatus Parcubacteria bacterium]|nr:hypothetical protein [Candidatus Parcubacteria bacterium]
MRWKQVCAQGALVVALAVSAAPVLVSAQTEMRPRPTAREEDQHALRLRKIDRAKAHGKRMVRREEAAIARLNRLIERIEIRIAKERASGREVAALEPLLAAAKEKLATAITAVREAALKYEALGTTDNPRKVAQEANAATKKVKVALMELHAALRQIVGALKALR